MIDTNAEKLMNELRRKHAKFVDDAQGDWLIRDPDGKFRAGVDERIAKLGKTLKVAKRFAKDLSKFKSKQAEATQFRDYADEIAAILTDLENIRARIE
jgi:hypothetical protein